MASYSILRRVNSDEDWIPTGEVYTPREGDPAVDDYLAQCAERDGWQYTYAGAPE